MGKYRNAYTTLATMRTSKDITSTDDDSELVGYIYDASRMIDRWCLRVFEPYKDTRTQDIADLQLLVLDADLLSLTSITENSVAVTSGTYALLPNNDYPKTQVTRLAGNVWAWDSDAIQAISITGVWGYNRNPDAMFASLSTLDGALTASDTTVTLAGAVSATVGYPSLIKVGDEYMRVTATPTTTTLTVTRGSHGTTATTHDNGDVVTYYIVPDDINYACQTLALYLYETRDNFGERVATVDGSYEISKMLPVTVKQTLSGYKRQRFFTP